MMEVRVGRFEGYLSDKNPTDIILALLSKVKVGGQRKIDPTQLQSDVYKMKETYPALLKDIYFSETSFFPHSEEVDMAIHTLQCAGYIERPNPKLASFTMDVKKPIYAEWMSQEEKQQIDCFAETLLHNLK
ncbi:MAG: hypothetical protein LBR47_04030 [Spirochaetaceae bacterium]|jgi:hypothetical protein|nr:hypothetical protein [Spirochaetaceae bacterium]